MQIFFCPLLYIVLTIFYPPCSWAAEPVILETDGGEYPVALHLDILEDKEGILTIEDVTLPKLTNKFIPHNNESAPSFAFTNSTYWVRFTARNNSPEEKEWFLEIAYPPLDYIELYIQNPSGDFTIKKTGGLLPFSNRDVRHRNFIFRLPIAFGDAQTYYLRFKTETIITFPMTIYSRDRFSEKDDDEYIVLGIYYGIIFVMVLYNLFIFFSLRDRNYLFYILYVTAHGLFQAFVNGIAYEYLWPTLPWWNKHAGLFFGMLAMFWVAAFSRSFLITKKYTPKLDRLLLFIVLSDALTATLSLISYSIAIKMGAVFGGLTCITAILAGIICWRKGYHPARYFAIALFSFLIGTIMMVLLAIGILPSNFLTLYSMQFGSGMDVILLSLALADRINTLNKEKIDIMNTVERKKREAIEERERIKREIHDSIGSSFVKAMLLTDAIKRGDEINLNDLKTVLTEGLSDSRELMTVDERNNTLGEIVSYAKEIAHSLQGVNQIKCIVSSEIKDEGIYIPSAVKLNLIRIIQECVANIIKHAEAKRIDLTLSENSGKITIKIKDNGKGFEPLEARSKGHGLNNIRKRCEGIGARLSINSEPLKGTEIEVAFKLSSLPLQPPPP